MVVIGKGTAKWAKWVKGSGGYRLPVTEYINHETKKHSVENIVNDIVITLYGDRW